MISISNLSVAYGAIVALDDVTIEAPTGAITAVLGANGAGKTTLLRTISGLVKPRSGSITANGHSLIGQRPDAIARLGIAHVPEGRGVMRNLRWKKTFDSAPSVRRRTWPRVSRSSTHCSPFSRNAGSSTPLNFPVANARCWLLVAP